MGATIGTLLLVRADRSGHELCQELYANWRQSNDSAQDFRALWGRALRGRRPSTVMSETSNPRTGACSRTGSVLQRITLDQYEMYGMKERSIEQRSSSNSAHVAEHPQM